MHPFTKDSRQSIGAQSEAVLISRIGDWLGCCSSPPPYGMGDDCAVLTQKTNLSAIDPIIFNKHFDDSVSPQAAGAKLLKRNLSDIAAMGGQASTALLALTAASSLRLDWLEGFVEGVRQAAERYGVMVIGGDLAQGPPDVFVAYVSIAGFAKNPIPRRGAKIGDTLWVTGTLGGSLLGKHLTFEPRLKEAQWLAKRVGVRGMIDLTDGLAKDLPALIPEEAVGELELAKIPLSNDALKLAKTSGHSPLRHAFSDGEDYELAFALDAATNLDVFQEAWSRTFELPLTCIGRVLARPQDATGPLLEVATGRVIELGGGYQHFSG